MPEADPHIHSHAEHLLDEHAMDAVAAVVEHDHPFEPGHIHTADCGHHQANIYIDRPIGERHAGHHDHEHTEQPHVHGPGCGHVGHEDAAPHIEKPHVHSESCGHLHHHEAKAQVDNGHDRHAAKEEQEHRHEHVHDPGCGHVHHEEARVHVDHLEKPGQHRHAIGRDAPEHTYKERQAAIHAQHEHQREAAAAALREEENQRRQTTKEDLSSEKDHAEVAQSKKLTDKKLPDTSTQEPVPLAAHATPELHDRIAAEVEPAPPDTQESKADEPEITRDMALVEDAQVVTAEVVSLERIGEPQASEISVIDEAILPVEQAAAESVGDILDSETAQISQDTALPEEPHRTAISGIVEAPTAEPTEADIPASEAVVLPEPLAAIVASVHEHENPLTTESQPFLPEAAVAEVEELLAALSPGSSELQPDITPEIKEQLLEIGHYLQPAERIGLLRCMQATDVTALRAMFERLIEQTRSGLFQEDGFASSSVSTATDSLIAAVGKMILQLLQAGAVQLKAATA